MRIMGIYAHPADVATEAARKVLAGRLDEKASAELFKDSLTALETKLN